MHGHNGALAAMTVAGRRERMGARAATSAIRQRNVSGLWSGVRMARLLVSCAVLLVMLVVAPAASAMLIDPVAHSARACSITGTGGADRLSGTAGDDRVCGLGGADRIRGERGHDLLVGGAGSDLLQGKAGRDRLEGGPGNDRAFGGAGADDIRGGSGSDILGGGLGPDGLSGGSGRDIVVYGQRGLRVTVTIGAGANDGFAAERDNVKADVESVQAGRGNDVITGNGASNRLFGGGGKDRIVGKGGSDVLIGAGGDDGIDAREGAAAAGRAAQAGSSTTWSAAPGMTLRSSIPSTSSTRAAERRRGRPCNPASGGQSGADRDRALAHERGRNQPVGTTVGALSAGDPDPGDTHSFALVPGQGSDDNGSFQIVGNTLRTDAVFNYESPEQYTVRIRATDFGTPAGRRGAFAITVTDVNDPPTAVDDSATVVEDSAAGAIDVLANDTDVDGGPMTIVSASDPAHGTVVVTGGGTGLTYQPDANYCNAARHDPTRSRTRSTAARRRPCRSPSPASTTRRRRSTTPPPWSRTRPRPRSTCWPTTPTPTADRCGRVGHAAGERHGGDHRRRERADLRAGRELLQQPGRRGAGHVHVHAQRRRPATVSVTVTCVDDPPTAVNDSATVAEDAAATAIDVLANDTDVDGGPKAVASVDPAGERHGRRSPAAARTRA